MMKSDPQYTWIRHNRYRWLLARPLLSHNGQDGVLTAFWRGVQDGWAEPAELSAGLTYDDDAHAPRSVAYDEGANLGQWLGWRAPWR